MSGPLMAEEKRFGMQLSPTKKATVSPEAESRPGTANGSPESGGGVLAATTGSRLASKVRGAVGEERGENDPYTLIFSKVRHGHIEAVQKLLAQGVAVDGRDKFGNTPLMTAAQNGKYKVAKFLVKSGCNVNLQNGQGNTAIHFCMAYGFKKLGEMLLKGGADATLRNRAGMTCYEGIDVKARAAGSELADIGQAHAVNTASDLAAIKVEELKEEITMLKENLAEQENRTVIECDIIQQKHDKLKAKAEKTTRELQKNLQNLEANHAKAAKESNNSAGQLQELTAKLKASEKDSATKIAALDSKLSSSTAVATQAKAYLEAQLKEALSSKEALVQQMKLADEASKLVADQMAELEAKSGEGAAVGAAQKNKLAEMTNKWSAEVMERKKFEDNLKLKTSVCDRLDKELEALRPAHEKLTAEHTETCAKLEARVVELTDVHNQLGAIEGERASLKTNVDGLSKQLADATAGLKAAVDAKGTAEASAQKATAGAGAAEKHLQAEVDKLKQADTKTKADLADVTKKLKAVEENELKLMGDLTKAKKAAAAGAAGASAAADGQLATVKAEAAAAQEALRGDCSKMESKLRLAEQELLSCRALISEEQLKCQKAEVANTNIKAEMEALMSNADARAKMLQSCVETEKERCSELETKLAAEAEKADAAAAVEKQNVALKAELDETKAKLATLWSQFLGGK